MRQIYTSPRRENVDRVVDLMTAHRIATTQTNRQAWQGGQWKRFSYTSAGGERDSWPQVWVVRAEDQTRARQLLRDAGLEPAIRFADELAAARAGADPNQRNAVPRRLRLILFALIAGIVVLIALNRLSI